MRAALALVAPLAFVALISFVGAEARAQHVSQLVLSEVLYDTSGVDDQLEWVELFNGYSTPVELCGFTLSWAGTGYGVAMAPLAGTVASGSYYLVGGPTSAPENGNPVLNLAQDLAPDLSNGGSIADAVGLFDVPVDDIPQAFPTDAVIYGGGTNDHGLFDETGDTSVDVGDAPAGSSIERASATTWLIQAAPTPGTGPLAGGGGPAPTLPCPPPPTEPEVEAISFGALTADRRADFSDLPAGGDSSDPGGLISGTVIRSGLRIGEHLSGQFLEALLPDLLAGTPIPPIEAIPGVPGQNLALMQRPVSAPVANILYGMTSGGLPSGFGEGSIAIVFDADQSEVGLELFRYSAGDLLVTFYARDGAPLGSITVPIPTGGSDTPHDVAFRHVQSRRRIAALTLEWNMTAQGPGIEAITIGAPTPVPTAGALALTLLGLCLGSLGAYAARSAQRNLDST